MMKWLHPDNVGVTGEVGDRLLLLVHEYGRKGRLDPRIVILVVAEDGFGSDDPMYQGYAPDDGVLFVWEKDLCRDLASSIEDK